MIKWTRTSSLSMKISLSLAAPEGVSQGWRYPDSKAAALFHALHLQVPPLIAGSLCFSTALASPNVFHLKRPWICTKPTCGLVKLTRPNACETELALTSARSWHRNLSSMCATLVNLLRMYSLGRRAAALFHALHLQVPPLISENVSNKAFPYVPRGRVIKAGSSDSYHREVRGPIPGGGGFFTTQIIYYYHLLFTLITFQFLEFNSWVTFVGRKASMYLLSPMQFA